MINYFLNGKPSETKDNTTIANLLDDLNLPKSSVIIEFNQEFLERSLFEKTRVQEDAKVEIIRAFAGG